MLEEIRTRLKLAPFIPFRIRAADGGEYPVPTPDHLWLPPGSANVYVFGDEALLAIIPFHLVSTLLTTDPEQATTASN